MKKHRGKILIAVSLAMCIFTAVLFYSGISTENRIKRYVLSNEHKLYATAMDYLNGGSFPYTSLSYRAYDFPRAGRTIVQFDYTGLGIAPSAKYYGFYYSPDNQPAAFQNAAIKLNKMPDGSFVWSDGTDNGGMTKRIKSGWYYYEAWF